METLQKSKQANSKEEHRTAGRETSSPLKEITPRAMKIIRHKVKELVGKCGFHHCDCDDIEQELYLDLWERLDKFDAEKAKYSTFVQRVVDNKVANILRERCSDKATVERTATSLSTMVEVNTLPRGTLALRDSITNDQYNEFIRSRILSCEEDRDLVMDIQEILGGLPGDLHRSCELLMEGRTIDEVVGLVGMKRSTFYRKVIMPLREVFQRAELKIFS